MMYSSAVFAYLEAIFTVERFVFFANDFKCDHPSNCFVDCATRSVTDNAELLSAPK